MELDIKRVSKSPVQMGTHIDKSPGTDSGERGEASCPPSFII